MVEMMLGLDVDVDLLAKLAYEMKRRLEFVDGKSVQKMKNGSSLN